MSVKMQGEISLLLGRAIWMRGKQEGRSEGKQGIGVAVPHLRDGGGLRENRKV